MDGYCEWKNDKMNERECDWEFFPLIYNSFPYLHK